MTGSDQSGSATHEKVALVTGAGNGIGLALTQRLRNNGYRVLAVDLDATAAGGDSLEVDLSTREGNQIAVEQALERHGRLDVIVANAGFQHVSPIPDFDPDRWDALLSVLLTSPFLLAKFGWHALAQAPEGGRFIAVASAHALVSSPFKVGYVSAKHGLTGLVKTIALEGAEVGITSTALCPGYVRTRLIERQIAEQAQAHNLPEDQVLSEVLLAAQAVKRLIEPGEIVDAIEFLLGPAGRAFTGASLAMDQGWSAR